MLIATYLCNYDTTRSPSRPAQLHGKWSLLKMRYEHIFINNCSIQFLYIKQFITTILHIYLPFSNIYIPKAAEIYAIKRVK